MQAKIEEGKGGGGGGGGLQLEKLTHGYWRQYIRREVLLAQGERQTTTNLPVTRCRLDVQEAAYSLLCGVFNVRIIRAYPPK